MKLSVLFALAGSVACAHAAPPEVERYRVVDAGTGAPLANVVISWWTDRPVCAPAFEGTFPELSHVERTDERGIATLIVSSTAARLEQLGAAAPAGSSGARCAMPMGSLRGVGPEGPAGSVVLVETSVPTCPGQVGFCTLRFGFPVVSPETCSCRSPNE